MRPPNKKSPDFLGRMRWTLQKHQMLQTGDRVLVALSGGPDSLALLHGLMALQKEWDLIIEAAHFDHGLREGVSEEEARWVAWQCREWRIPCHFGRWDQLPAPGVSLEAAAREARLAFLEKVQAQIGARVIAQGHHGDDQVETVVMRLLNGAGVGALGGISPVRSPYIRPLIEMERQEIEAYCQRHHLQPRIDDSNWDKRFLRNRLRLELIPLMKTYNPNLTGTVAKTAEILRKEDQLLQKMAQEACRKALIHKEGEAFPQLDLHKLADCEPALLPRVLRCWLGMDADYDTIGRILSLSQGKKTGKKVDLKEGWQVRRTYNGLALQPPQEKEHPLEAGAIPLMVGKYESVPGRGEGLILSLGDDPEEKGSTKLILPWKAGVPLPVLRRRLPGDWLQLPFGRKKLKEWFIDRKVPVSKRDGIWLIAWGAQILWVLDQVQALGPFEKGEINLKMDLVKDPSHPMR